LSKKLEPTDLLLQLLVQKKNLTLTLLNIVS